MLAFSHPRYYSNRVGIKMSLLWLTKLRGFNIWSQTSTKWPSLNQQEGFPPSRPLHMSYQDHTFWLNCMKWLIFGYFGPMKMAISNDPTQEIWEGIWGCSGSIPLLQFSGNTHLDCSDDPKCAASAGHSCHCRGTVGPCMIPGPSPHACGPRQFLRVSKQDLRELNRVSLPHLL